MVRGLSIQFFLCFYITTFLLAKSNNTLDHFIKFNYFKQNKEIDSSIYYAKKGLFLIKNNDKNSISMGLEYSDFLIENNINQEPLSFLLRISEENHDKDYKQKTLLLLSRLFYKIKSYDLSIKNYRKTLQYKSNNENDFYLLGEIGTTFIKKNNLDSSIAYFNKQLRLANENKLNFHDIALSYNNLGYTYSVFNKEKESIENYNRSIEILLSQPSLNDYDSLLLYNLYGNVGKMYFKLKEYEKAEKLIEKEFLYILKNNFSYPKQYFISKELFKIYLKTKNFNKFELLKNRFLYVQELSIEDKINLTENIIKYYQIKGINDSLLKFYNSLFNLNKAYHEEFSNKMNENNHIISSYLVNQSYLENKLLKKEAEQTKSQLIILKQNDNFLRLLITVIIVISLILIISAIVFFIIRKKSIEMKNKYLNKVKENLEMELRLKEKDVTSLALNISQKEVFNKEIIAKLKEIKADSIEEIKKGIESLIKDLSSNLSSNKLSSKLNQNMNTISSSFYEKIENEQISLTKNEKELCALIRLNLSNKEISNLKGVSISSIKMSKYRLKKKLNLSDEQSLSSFIEKL